MVTIQEAERRSSFGENPLNKTYLFDLECQIGVDCDYVVDGEKYGNISRFINHSVSERIFVSKFAYMNQEWSSSYSVLTQFGSVHVLG